jgi:hypothetical protein
MKTNESEIKSESVEMNRRRAGFNASIMPVMGKTEEFVYFFLPGDITITEHANRFKGLLGIEYTPKNPSTEKREYTPRLGLHAKIRLSLSRDGQWVTVYLPGNMGRITHHRNAYLHLLSIPYQKKSKVA